MTISEIADYISIVGFPITIIGFAVAIYQIVKTKKSSELAKRAVESFRNDLSKFDTIGSFAEVLSSIIDLKRFIRVQNYEVIPDRLYQMRHVLIGIRESGITLKEEQEQVFQEAISTFRLLEDNFEKRLTDSDDGSDNPKILKKISGHADALKAVQMQLRKEMENSHE